MVLPQRSWPASSDRAGRGSVPRKPASFRRLKDGARRQRETGAFLRRRHPDVTTWAALERDTMETNAEGLSRLTTVAVRSIWKHAPHDFTLWLLENADVLGDALGMDLELTEAERRVGGFALDLIGTDLATNTVVIVENQLEQTDHSHLGQLLTYAGGTDPSTIVWCAPSFREEHRAALDWLNEHTDEETRFFGVEIAAVRIDESRPAPLFRIVAKPNDWTKQLHTERAAVTLSPKSLAYQEFWSELLAKIRAEHPTWTRSTAGSTQSWITLPYGTSSIWYGMAFTITGPRVELYFGGPDAATNLAEFERLLSTASCWTTSSGRRFNTIRFPARRRAASISTGPMATY